MLRGQTGISMLTQYARYALKALLYLADNPRETPHPVIEIAEQASIPRKFLETILADLKRHGVVISTRGKKGGYRLARPADQVSFGDIIRHLDGPLSAMLAAEEKAGNDHFDDALQAVMLRAADRLAETLDGISLADAVGPRT